LRKKPLIRVSLFTAVLSLSIMGTSYAMAQEDPVGDDREVTCSSENPPPVEECFGPGSDQNNNGIADVNEEPAADTDETFEQVPDTSAGVDTGGR
jgi:hypothetical protein